MKKLIFILLSILLATGGFFGYQYYKDTLFTPTIKQNKIIKNELKKLPKEEVNNTIISEPISKTTDEKIDTLKKRFSLKGTIARGDNFFEGNQLILAMNEYNKALKQNPKDEQIIKKLAHTYFELKRYKEAVVQYSKVEAFLSPDELSSYIHSLIYLVNFKSPESLQITNEKIQSLPINDEDKFYFLTTILSASDLHSGKKAFEDYFAKNPNITSKHLQMIKTAFENYKNFQVNDIYYKDALMIGAFFQDRMFSVSSVLAQNMLKEKPDYKPMILVLGKGNYELGNLNDAKVYLEQYYKINPKDVNITYILGTLNFKLKDYITSNLYYNAAIKNGFEPKLELQRKLAYNYYLSGDKRSMLNMFSFLLNEKDANIDDFSLGIYHAILEGRTLNAIRRSEDGLKKFAGQAGYEIFYAYIGWVKREEKDFEASRKFLQAGLKVNPKNPLLTLNMGYLEEFEEKYNMAIMYFKRTQNINGDGEFGELAQNEITQIEKFIETQKSTASGATSK